MLKPKFFSIVLFFLIKYLTLYILLMFKDNNYKILEISNIKNGADLFYYLWVILFLPLISIAIFSFPLIYSFRLRQPLYFSIIIMLLLGLEYVFYTYFASQANLMNGVYNLGLSLLFLFIFFYRSIPFFRNSVE